MEKTLTRLKSNLKSRRKLSLPMLAGHFPWQQQQSASEPHIEEASPRAESAEILAECDASPSENVEGAENGDECEGGAANARPKTWLSFGKSRHAKQRNKPRRWPSTPAILPTTRANPQPASNPPAGRHHHASAGSLSGNVSVRPQPYIQGYHLTLPSFLCQRAHHHSHSPTSKVAALSLGIAFVIVERTTDRENHRSSSTLCLALSLFLP